MHAVADRLNPRILTKLAVCVHSYTTVTVRDAFDTSERSTAVNDYWYCLDSLQNISTVSHCLVVGSERYRLS